MATSLECVGHANRSALCRYVRFPPITDVNDSLGIGGEVSALSDQDETEEVVSLKQLNGELSDSLGRCRDILRDYRERLATISNHLGSLEASEVWSAAVTFLQLRP